MTKRENMSSYRYTTNSRITASVVVFVAASLLAMGSQSPEIRLWAIALFPLVAVPLCVLAVGQAIVDEERVSLVSLTLFFVFGGFLLSLVFDFMHLAPGSLSVALWGLAIVAAGHALFNRKQQPKKTKPEMFSTSNETIYKACDDIGRVADS